MEFGQLWSRSKEANEWCFLGKKAFEKDDADGDDDDDDDDDDGDDDDGM